MDDKARVTVRMPGKLKADAERVSAASGVSVNAVILLALREYIARFDKKKVISGG